MATYSPTSRALQTAELTLADVVVAVQLGAGRRADDRRLNWRCATDLPAARSTNPWSAFQPIHAICRPA